GEKTDESDDDDDDQDEAEKVNDDDDDDDQDDAEKVYDDDDDEEEISKINEQEATESGLRISEEERMHEEEEADELYRD
nr:hypothetical protein [Tanacetum cinerariifolium]